MYFLYLQKNRDSYKMSKKKKKKDRYKMQVYQRKDGTIAAYERKDGKQLLSVRLSPDLIIEMKVYAARNRTTVAGFLELAAREKLAKEGVIMETPKPKKAKKANQTENDVEFDK